MWGYEVALRVRDRKIGEIAKVMGYTNADRRYKLLGELGRDLEICNCTISGSGVCAIPSTPVSDPGYRSALSGTDLDDETDLDSVRAAAPQIKDFIREAFQEAARSASEDRSEPYREAVGSLKEELSACRERIERLSAEMDYKSSELAASEDERKLLEETIDRQASEIGSLKSRISDLLDDAGISRARMEELSAQIEELKASAEAVKEDAPVAAEVAEPVQEDVPVEKTAPAPEPVQADESTIIGRIKDMKSSKIDLFMDRMLSGEMDIDGCDDLVSVLKVDIAILEAVERSEDPSNISVFAAEPSQQVMDEYMASLTDEEKVLEESFKEILRKAFSTE